jgi:hypothetical protein
MSKKSLETAKMSDATWTQFALKEHVAPNGTAQSISARIRLAARRLEWKYSRTETLWYADERASIKPAEIRRIEEVTGLEYGRQELRSVDQILSNADALLMGVNADYYSAFVAGLRAFAGALHRPGTPGADE